MKYIIPLLIIFSLATPASAKYSSKSFFDDYAHAGYASLANSRAGIDLGIDYENAYDPGFGLGGYFRMYSKDDTKGITGVTLLGAFIRPHFYKRSWDFYISPGFGFIKTDPPGTASSETTFGPSLSLGLIYQLTEAIAFGMENMIQQAWFSDKIGPEIKNDLMAKIRMGF